ncbi:MAG: tRNA pseudouridine(13) synthase TruD [Planctomycetaceae bacterium]|nr:tRNA pseudouridine(13) synthase TruD [Planctomycetaceae bacterium]
MKLRQIPEDFIVEEIPAFTPAASGRYFVYEINKRSIATLDVLDILRKALRVPGHEVSASGLKDKHAIARQLVSLPKPLPATFRNDAFDWSFVGKAGEPLNANNVGANRFAITARALQLDEVQAMHAGAEALRKYGVPNFYDSQRFGGGHRDELPGRAILKQDYEEALRLHLAVPRRKQSLRDKRVRRICAKYWRDWAKISDKLPRCRELSVIGYLREHPDDLRGALERVDTKLTKLYLAAYQSLLFNDSLNALLTALVPAEQLIAVKYKAGEMQLWRALDDELFAQLSTMNVPLLNHSTLLDTFDPVVREAVNTALANDGMKLEQLVVKGFDRLRLHGAERAAMLRPEGLTLDEAMPDELNPDRMKLTARFTLPRGSFATVVMKRLGTKGD